MPRQYITVRSITLHRKMLCTRKCIEHCMMCVAPGNAFAWGKYFVQENVFHQEVRYPRLRFTPGYALHQNVHWARMCNAPGKNALLMNFFAAGIAPHQEMYTVAHGRMCIAPGSAMQQDIHCTKDVRCVKNWLEPGNALHQEQCCTRKCVVTLDFALYKTVR
jgi:hypothetical protein